MSLNRVHAMAASISDTIDRPTTSPDLQRGAKPAQRWTAAAGADDTTAVLIACLVGALVALSGFPPLNNLPAYLHMEALPGFVVLSPACLVALLAVWAARRGRSSRELIQLARLPRPVAAAVLLLLAGAALSLLQSPRPSHSASLIATGMLAPLLIFLAVRSGGLPVAPIAGGFIAMLVVLLVRADLTFFHEHGFPTAQALFQAKFSKHAYDFHYYTLGNPDHTAGFLILPLALCLFWAIDRSNRRPARMGLLFASLVILATILLLYVRLADLAALLLVLTALLRLPWSRRVRWGGAAIVLGGAVVLAARSPNHYLLQVFSLAKESSGTERVGSVGAGWDALLHHPITGVGLGFFGSAGAVPAHSAIVEAGAEMGVFGLLGMGLMTLSLVGTASIRLHRRALAGLRGAAILGATAQVVFMTVTGDAAEGLMEGFTSIYGLSLALAVGIGTRLPIGRGHASRLGVMDTVATASRYIASWARARWLQGRSAVAWLTYGLLWAGIALWLISARLPQKSQLTSSRETEYARVLAAHHGGFGPLVSQIGPHTFLPSGITDDPGGYLYAPWLADVFHASSIDTVVRLFYMLAMAVLAGAYPYLIWRITHSRLAALCAPILVVIASRPLDGHGFYWVPGWTVALTLPWLWVLVRDRSKILMSVSLIGALAGVTSTFRSNSGVGPLLAAMTVAVIVSTGWRRRAVGIVLPLVAYVALSTGILDVAYQTRAERMAHYPLNVGEGGVTKWSDPSGHPFWHTAYIGLGVIPNRYGITYNDSVAAAYVRRVDPRAPYVSPSYESILRKQVIHIVETDPGFVAKVIVRKVETELKDGLSNYLALIFLLPIALVAGAGRGRRRSYAATMAPIALVAFAPALLAVPLTEYELPWFGLLVALTVVSSSWFVALAGSMLRQVAERPTVSSALSPLGKMRDSLRAPFQVAAKRVSRLLQTTSHTVLRGLVRMLQPIATALRVMADASTVAHADLSVSVRRAGFKALRSPSVYAAVAMIAFGLAGSRYLTVVRGTEPSMTSVGAPVQSLRTRLPPIVEGWLATKLASKWTIESGVRATVDHGHLGVVTTGRTNAYQLLSPVKRLLSGRYMIVAAGRILSGGMELGVLDVKADRWLAITDFTNIEEQQAVAMPISLSLDRPTVVRVVLANAASGSRVSHWLLQSVSIRSPSGHPRFRKTRAASKAPRPTHARAAGALGLRASAPPARRGPAIASEGVFTRAPGRLNGVR